MSEKKEHPAIKSRLHPSNKHRERYDFKALIEKNPELKNFVAPNKYGDESVDFFNPKAVKELNKSLLLFFYGLDYWDIPDDYLCPPVPGRADYIHHVAELLGNKNFGNIPKGKNFRCLDIGVGANCIYPIIGSQEYGWSFVGSEIDPYAIKSAEKIVSSNANLKDLVEIRLQPNPKNIFSGIVNKDEVFDLVISNPPFHSSAEEAQNASQRKLSNLKNKKVDDVVRNFGGKNTELWYDGGERMFVDNMIKQSSKYRKSSCWFSTLISKQSNLKHAYNMLKDYRTAEVRTIRMGQGNKSSRILVWTFLPYEEQQVWAKERWG